MSTNYYWYVAPPLLPTGDPLPTDRDHPSIHIGRRHGLGGGKVGFSWAQHPEQVKAVCRVFGPRTCVETEGGGLLTGWQFLEMLESVAEHNLDTIGQRFC